ncbi:mitochondrial coenzyme A diphosphatase NUDT8-like [Heptranchias perlo]|uniref:mitochondrial coenzyme A diphosphatase NUDT8-like n=1 Tax=Heptranchias perlo TaxID=212740 RepID=UPI00355A7248
MSIVPVLAHLGALDSYEININPNEVEDVFTISLRHVCAERNRGYTRYRYQGCYAYTLPVFLHAKYKVWGLSAVMIDAVLCLLFPGEYRSSLRGARPRNDR